jgi:magnesium transporter
VTDTSHEWLPKIDPGSEAAIEEDYSLAPELVEKVREALEQGQIETVREMIEPLHVADVADLLEYLTKDELQLVIEGLWSFIDAEVLTYLDAAVREEVIDLLGPRELARAVTELDSDDAVEVFEDLDEEAQHRILSRLPRAFRALLEESLTYPEDSAGRLMQREMVVIPSAWSVGETIDHMREAEDLPDDFYDLFIVNPKHKPIGFVPLSRVLRTKRPVRLTEIMDTDLWPIPLTMNQEDVAYTFRQYGLVSAPVVDEAGRLVGVITVDDVVRVIDEEAEEDLMKMAGLGESDLYNDLLETVRARSPWLVVNLMTAILASLVIGLFEGTIEKVVALAVLMPIVASMGGNAGTQTLTVAVRALAMKDLSSANAWRFINKELLVGLFNGLVFAVITGAAMVVNLIVAGLSGTLIPIGLERLGVDPAIASSVFLTTVTDVIGFFAFLGLAAAFLL